MSSESYRRRLKPNRYKTMKKRLLLLPALCLTQLPLNAQVTVVAPTAAAPNVVVVRTLDPVVVRQQLSLPPKVSIVPPTTVVSPEPQTALKTTKTTTVVDTPGQPRRVYNSERSVVIVEDQGQSREMPYVTLPVLFVKETNELLDQESRVALQQVAAVIAAISQTEPGTLFDIEGHTSTDGTDEFNLELSAIRAQRVFDELTQNYGIPASLLSAHGYGESFPSYPQGSEEQMQQDRRVLVVRTK
jgi:outer membrane protein OmpA-like peptidoglycan-associated protein